ncbi:MAG: hypothetical protein V4611_01855 [Patescibacteria group bacterium]
MKNKWKYLILGVVIAISATAFILAYQKQQAANNTPKPAENIQTYEWPAAKKSVEYTDTWKQDSSNNGNTIDYKSPVVRAGSPNEYFCVTFKIVDEQQIILTANQLEDLGNGLGIYRQDNGDQLSAALGYGDGKLLRVTGEDKYVSATIKFACNAPDPSKIRSPYQKQLRSEEYRQAVETVRSFSL